MPDPSDHFDHNTARHTVRHLVTSDDRCLRFRHFPTDASPRGVVVGLHGIQSHSGWYLYSSQKLAEAGFQVYFADRRGAGLNGFQRGHADHGLRLVHDVRQLVRLVRREHPDVPITLMGVSWGGKTTAAFAALYPRLVDRIALLYPGLDQKIRPNWWQRLQLSAARRHDVRHRIVRLPLDRPQLFTASGQYQQFIADDPLALHAVTSGFLNSGRDLDRIIQRHPKDICQPTLLMLAGKDQIVNNALLRQRVAGFGCQQLTILEYPEAAHSLEFEPNRDEIVCDLIKWLN